MRYKHLFLVAAALAVAACGGKKKASLPTDVGPTGVVGVKAVKPKAGEAALTRATAELRARREAVLSPEVSGRIARTLVDVGDRVQKGQVLLELSSSTAALQAEQAKAAKAMAEAGFKAAETEHKRTLELAKGDAAPQALVDRVTTALEQARAGLQQATVAVEMAQDYHGKHFIRAPFDGVVTARYKSAGEFVTSMPATPVYGLVDVGSVELRVAVPETVVDVLKPGAELDGTLSPSGKAFKARVRVVGTVVEPGSRSVDVRADVSGKLPSEARPGAIAELTLGGKGAVAGLFVPSDAIHGEGAETFVFAVEGDKLRRRKVQVERLNPGQVRILSGIGADELVVVEGAAGLSDGATVRVSG
ncbi:MAG TPA: efflux RND transporter periplasmic adaptor subunit [Anaeromyxobacteraceae bacterium]|nr:efflux RND transporter periplasmic adaptor subunit [Anaeromyxobacteraceae bacterium]